MKIKTWISSFVLASAAAVVPTQAALIAFDNAADAAYDDGYQTGDNGGFGFLPWTLSGNTFLGQSQTNGFGDGNIDTAGRAWGFYDEGVQSRPFAAELEVGDTFSIAFDNGFLNNGNTPGFRLVDAGGNEQFAFYFVGGTGSYRISDGSVDNFETGIGYTSAGLEVEFTLLAGDTYSVFIKRNVDATGTTISGNSLRAGGDVSGLQIFGFGNTPDGSGDYFANSISIESSVIPEPAGLALLAPAAVLLRRRRA